jgi:hypothetical protein
MADDRRAFRTRVLESCEAPPQLIDELLAYGDQPVAPDRAPGLLDVPLPDESHIESWLTYEREAHEVGVFAALQRHFVQLRFPIQAGLSQDAAYRQATLKGDFAAADAFRPGLVLARPERLELEVRPTIAGRIPILIAGDRDDFVALVRALTERNEPAPVPDAMGACIVKGLNNWSRIARYREDWSRDQDVSDESAWAEEFRRLVPQKARYQDRLIILSRGTYSAVASGDVGLTEQDWLARSLVIRREHECTHYFVYRAFGVMRTHVFDELIADFVGLTRAFGGYRADLALRVLGLESFPGYRRDGRLENYRGDPPLSDEAFAVVRCLAFRSVKNLEALAASRPGLLEDLGGLGRLTFALSGLTLEELAEGVGSLTVGNSGTRFQ